MTRVPSLLIVDDSEWNRDVLSRRLAPTGYSITVAADGQAALALIGSRPFDLVLLDVDMPGMNGLEVLTRLRVDHSQTALPVIMVTGRVDGADIVEAFDRGANDYVTKPIDFPVTLARIRTHVAHKWALEDLRESQERYALAVRGANDGLWDWNLTTNEVYWSERWKEMLGYAGDEIGVDPEEWFSRIHPDDVERVRRTLKAEPDNQTGHYEVEHRVAHRDGTYRWVLCRGAAVSSAGGSAIRLAGSLTDITDAKVADVLTGLPNRLLFADLLDRAIKRTERKPGYLFALLVLGLDRFDVVSQSLGQTGGDRLLVAVARRLQACVRPTDTVSRDRIGLTLARFGGSEFTVLVDDITDASDAVRVAERLRAVLQAPFELDGQQVFTSAAFGIAVSTTGYARPEDMLHDAAIALHRAKAESAAPIELFDPAMRERAMTRLRTETDLRNAIGKREFIVHYQPIISLTSGRISGFEALVRWQHPVRGLVGPQDFIGLAEDTGLIRPIGQLVLEESCRQMALWQTQPDGPSVMCVNVAASQLDQPDFVEIVAEVLRSTGLAPAHLKLEITESAFVNDDGAAEATLARLRAIGVDCSIDDFGTGYSSLSYLQRLQGNTVKVDRSFIVRMSAEQRSGVLVRTIIALAHGLGMDVVAEGVETAEQLAVLQGLGCEHVQGFYFSRPVDAAAADQLIASAPWHDRLGLAVQSGLLRTS